MIFKKLTFYKPRQDYKGTALAINYNQKTKAVFLQVARQSSEKDDQGNFTFLWDNGSCIIVKLKETDISAIQCFYRGILDQCKLFHQPEEGVSAALRIERVEHKGKTYFAIRLSKQTADKKVKKVSTALTEPQMFLLEQYLSHAMERIFFEPISGEKDRAQQSNQEEPLDVLESDT